MRFVTERYGADEYFPALVLVIVFFGDFFADLV